MTELYSIASRLTLTTNALTVVADLAKAFERLDTIVGSTQGNIARLAAELRTLSGGSRGIGATVKALEGLEKIRLPSALLGDLDRATTAAREFATVQRELAKSSAETAAAYRTMGRLTPGGAGGGTPRRPGGGSASGGSHHDLLNTSMALTMAGDAGMGFFGSAIKAEMEVSQQLAALRMNTTITDQQIAAARATAERITRETPGTMMAENLHHIVDAFTIVGDINEAMAGAPALARMAYVLKNLPGNQKGDSSFAGMQAIEVMQRFYNPQTHQVDMEAFNKQLAAMTQVATGTGGRVDGAAYLGFAKQARVGGMVANDTFLYRDLPALLISLGGSRAGTGEAATFQQFITGRMTENAANQLKKAGLLDASARWKGGQVQGMGQHFHGYEMFGENAVEWVRNYMLGPEGALAKNHIDQNDKLAVAKFLSDFASRQTGLGWLAEMTLGMGGINKEGGKIASTTTNPMNVLQQSDPMQKMREFHAAENELLVTLGQNAMGPALEALKGLTAVIRDLSEWGKAHPDAAKNITLVGGALSALATGAGEAALVLYLGAPLLKGLGGLAKALIPFSAEGAAGLALTGLSAGLKALGVAATAIFAILELGSKSFTPESQKALEDTAKARRGGAPVGGVIPQGAVGGTPNDGFGPDGRPLFQRQSYVPPATGGAQVIHIINVTTLDGEVVARSVTKRQARDLNRPPSGITGFDGRMSPIYGGASYAT